MSTTHIQIENQGHLSDKDHMLPKQTPFSPKNKQSFNFEEDPDKSQAYREMIKEIRKKDARVSVLQEKVKKSEELAEQYKSKSKEFEFSLNFYKAKLQEECLRNNSCEDDLQTICSTIEAQTSRINKLIDISDQSTLFQSENNNPEESREPSQKAIKNLKILENQLTKLELVFSSKKKEPENFQKLYKSVNATIERKQRKYLSQKEQLNRELAIMKANYQRKATESEDYKRELSSILTQRSFTNELLVSSQKQKISLFNDVYTISKKQFNIDFQNMNKGDVVLLCLKLFTKIKDLEQVNQSLTKKVQKLETEAKDKYRKLLKEVRSIEKLPQTKLGRLRKMQSMPVE